MNIAVNSDASLMSNSINFFFIEFSSSINSNQNNDSSVSSITILNFAIKLAFDCTTQAAL